jgi:hypothetical protein
MSPVNNEFKMASGKCAFLDLAACSSFNFRHLGKECVEISYFDFDLKNNIVIL